MKTAVELAMEKAPEFTVPKVFGYAPPVSDETIKGWQAELDRYYDRRPRGARVVIYWEPGDPWQPINRFFLGQAVDPRFVTIEPWVLAALKGPNPRSQGHYCGDGYCLCEVKRYRWEGGASRFVTGYQWRMYRDTGLYVTPWWVIQGSRGGHRYKWEKEEVASLVASIKGLGDQPPCAGDLPYAPFDQRVLRAIRGEWMAKRASDMLRSLSDRKDSMALEERDEAEKVARALWDWTGDQAEALWNEGADAIPIVLEMEYGRAPIGHKIDFARQERFEERSLTRPVE